MKRSLFLNVFNNKSSFELQGNVLIQYTINALECGQHGVTLANISYNEHRILSGDGRKSFKQPFQTPNQRPVLCSTNLDKFKLSKISKHLHNSALMFYIGNFPGHLCKLLS
jgi:hypothetical protein